MGIGLFAVAIMSLFFNLIAVGTILLVRSEVWRKLKMKWLARKGYFIANVLDSSKRLHKKIAPAKGNSFTLRIHGEDYMYRIDPSKVYLDENNYPNAFYFINDPEPKSLDEMKSFLGAKTFNEIVKSAIMASEMGEGELMKKINYMLYGIIAIGILLVLVGYNNYQIYEMLKQSSLAVIKTPPTP